MMPLLDSSTSQVEWNATLDRAVAASRSLAGTSPTDRAVLLRQIAQSIETSLLGLVTIAMRETGLGRERLAGEVRRTANQFRLYANVVEEGSWLGVSIDLARPPFDDHRRMNVALGPVLVFAASNFPFAFGVLGTDTASAFAAGCAVVAKGHPGHPILAKRLASVMGEALEAAGFDESLFTLVSGDGVAVAALNDDRIEAGAFTGSILGGVALLGIAQRRPRPIPFFAEMGSINPVVVTQGAWEARGEEILSGYLASMTQSNGQLCTSPGVLFLPANPEIVSSIAESVARIEGGTLLTDSIAHSFRTGMSELAATPGVAPVSPLNLSKGRTAMPMVWNTDTEAVLLTPGILEERFGPSSVVIQYGQPRNVLEVIAGIDGQLTGSIFSEPGEDIADLVDALSRRVGRILNNSWPTGVAVSWSMHHGGPWPASSSAAFGSVGAEAISRFLRPVAYQNFAEAQLPPAVQDTNPWAVPQRIDGVFQLKQTSGLPAN